MSRKGKYRIEEKLKAVQEYLDDKDSMCSIAVSYTHLDVYKRQCQHLPKVLLRAMSGA